MKKLKSFSKGLLIGILIGGLLYGIFALVKYQNALKLQVMEIDQVCIVTEVEFYQIGSISVAQLDPEWKVKTSCGYNYTLRYPAKLGDTIHVKILRYKK